MPITKDEWSKGRTENTLEARIENFLSQNKSLAYTQAEIVNALFPAKDPTPLGEVVRAIFTFSSISTGLENLVREGRVKAKSVRKDVGEETYYSLA